ncbi:glutathione S-transferase N-terminal domain-containing protein [Nodosilinea sp. PGN35]|uniref:glutathione S-transferase N-terminal domain-containing protein n=1 Tax=Nodosilinea sp. PGN35 TaxID=3020489 RepID=UPI0023B30B83|nr:glutathione S-transferase N-terminal domain-containing protein [Nodosilinea sp. TSF1-S3]MDF0366315.1 glutathione S-transferase N-terminal domain-containing protein [Nodosilinea sp. TSF1-S3]
MAIVPPTWNQVLTTARTHTPARRLRRPGQSPSTAPVPIGLAAGEKPRVLLYRDSNSWCPFCERVWFALEEKGIAFETEFIDLQNKPQWYLDLVPTALVPAAKIDGQLVYESKDILLALEERFPDPALLPENPAEQAAAYEELEWSETSGFLQASYRFLRGNAESEEERVNLQRTLEGHLDRLETALGKFSGAFFLSRFSLVDILYSPHLDRLAACGPVYRDYSLRGNPRYPRLSAWFMALRRRPAYHRVRSDDTTNVLLLRRRFGLEPTGQPLPLNPEDSADLAYRAEAAERLADNREAAIADILKNAGVQALAIADLALGDIVDTHLRHLAAYLLRGDEPVVGGATGGPETSTPQAVAIAAIGAITYAYLHNRICAPRDMSAGAATALRAATEQLLVGLY